MSAFGVFQELTDGRHTVLTKNGRFRGWPCDESDICEFPTRELAQMLVDQLDHTFFVSELLSRRSSAPQGKGRAHVS
ncbi:MAG: hypothetical protein EVA65_16580 [Oceanococcus sp.]|nr:MAG: hypothetical protein EVA65_16580 [Oceanococcus sp.]